MAQHDSSDNVCWLCLCGSEAGELTLPCKCRHMFSHPQCLGRWQLQQAGREEEQHCRFCKGVLPSWTRTFLDGTRTAPTTTTTTPTGQHADPSQFLPAMLVICNGKMVRLTCTPTRAGAEEFKAKVQHIFHLDASQPLDVVFQMKVPSTSQDPAQAQRVHIEGFQAFEAAATVATICAAKRQRPPATVPAAGEPAAPIAIPRSCAASRQGSPLHSPRSAWSSMRASTGSLPASRLAQPDRAAAPRHLHAASSSQVHAAASAGGRESPRRMRPDSPGCSEGPGAAAGLQAKLRTLSLLSSAPSSPRAGSAASSPRGRRVLPLPADDREAEDYFGGRGSSSPGSSLAGSQGRGRASAPSSGGSETPQALIASPKQAKATRALARLLDKASTLARTSLKHLFSSSGKN